MPAGDFPTDISLINFNVLESITLTLWSYQSATSKNLSSLVNAIPSGPFPKEIFFCSKWAI